MVPVVSNDESRRARARARFLDRRDRRPHEAPVVRERQIVIRGEVENLDAIEDHARSLRRIDRARHPKAVLGLELLQLGSRVVVKAHGGEL
jgi:hypothetical protein